jgi:hypothetical protein
MSRLINLTANDYDEQITPIYERLILRLLGPRESGAVTLARHQYIVMTSVEKYVISQTLKRMAYSVSDAMSCWFGDE